MQINVSSRNPIVRFMQRINRFLTDGDDVPLPDDICSFTRQFLAFVTGYSFVVFMAGLALIVMASWPVCLIYGFPADPDSGMYGLLILGSFLWLMLLIPLISWARTKARLRGWVRHDGPIATARIQARQRIRQSLAAEMWRSFKDKTCVRVKVED